MQNTASHSRDRPIPEEDLSLEELRKALRPTYEIVQPLGHGGMGAVFKAWEPARNRQVAIKIIAHAPPDEEPSPGFNLPDGFRQEAQALARLSHPHIVSLYDFGETDTGVLYLVMEFVPGQSLQELLEAGSLPRNRALTWCVQVCGALQHAHDRGLTHRDIKPGNVLINSIGSAKLIDFGLVKSASSALPGSGWHFLSIGTPEYAAPEALENGAFADHRADVFSVGVMLYQLICGKRPLHPYIPPRLRQPDLDPRFDWIVAKAMQCDPEKRYQRIADLRSDLMECMTS